MIRKDSERSDTVGAEKIDATSRKIDAQEKFDKEDGVQKVEITAATWADDQTVVLNKDPVLYYVFARKDDMIEMAQFAKLGYEEAVGNEIVFGMKRPTPGKPKILNKTRILMCCPKALMEARQQAMLSRLNAERKTGNASKARELQSVAGESVGVSVFDGTQK